MGTGSSKEMYVLTEFSEAIFSQRGYYLIRIDSDVAGEMLKRNRKNRRIRKSHLKSIGRQIEQGEFQSNHPAPLIFDDAGDLMDGQHRLTEIHKRKLYGDSDPLLRVETMVDKSMRQYIDTGISRTLDDRVELCADPMLNKLASQLVTLQRVLFSSSEDKKPTPLDAQEFFTAHEMAIRHVFKRARKEKGVGQIAVCFAAMEYFERDAEKADVFYSDLFVSAGDIKQAMKLRDFLLKQVNPGGQASKRETYEKSVGCMKAHMDGRLVKKVVRGNWE